MGSAANENIALRINSTADVSGIRTARAETSALGQAAKQATDAAIAGETKLVATIEQVREAQSRANGDFAKFTRELASIVQGENALAAAAAKTTTELQKQAAVRAPVLPGPTGPQLGPALPGTPAGGGGGVSRSLALAEMQAYRMEAERNAVSLSKVSPAARQAGNAVGLLASAAATGTGSLSGLAVATGNVAQGLATMSNNAKFAAGAAGIGALAAAIGILIGLAIEAKQKLEAIPEGAISAGTSERIQNLTSIAAIERQIFLAREDHARKLAAVPMREGLEQALKLSGGTPATQAAADAGKKVEALETRLVEVRKDLREKAIADEKAARERQLALNKAADKELEAQSSEALDLFNRRTTSQFEATRLRAESEFAARQKEIAAMKVDEDRKTALLLTAARIRTEKLDAAKADADKEARDKALARQTAQAEANIALGAESGDLTARVDARIDEIARERDAMIKAGVDVLTATQIAENRKRALYRETAAAAAANAKTILDVLLSSSNKQLHAIGAFGETIRRVVIGAQAAHAAVEAAIEAGKAIGSAATGDFRGAALHAAAAAQLGAAAALGAQEALGARTGSGGGGAGGGGGGGSDQGTFTPRDANGATGALTIVLQTVHPYSREAIGETIYQINRSQVLKRPIPISPTTGLLGAG